MFWQPLISPGCVFMYTFWIAGVTMIGLAWNLEHSALGQAGLSAVIAAASVAVLRDGMRTRRQIAAIAKRREMRENGDDDTPPIGLIHPERF